MVTPISRHFFSVFLVVTLTVSFWPDTIRASGQKRLATPHHGEKGCCDPPRRRAPTGLIFTIPITFGSGQAAEKPAAEKPKKPVTRTNRRSPTLNRRGSVYRLPLRQPIRSIRSRHVKTVNTVAISGDGHWLAAGSTSGSTQVWDLTTGQQIWILPGHAGAVTGLGFFTKSNESARADVLLAVAGDDGAVTLWSLWQRRQLRRFQAHSRPITGLAAHWSKGFFATGGGDVIHLWDGTSARPLATFSDPQRKPVTALALSVDGKRLAHGGDGGIHIWNLLKGNLEKTVSGSGGGVVSLAWGRPRSHKLAAGYRNGEILLWSNVIGAEKKFQRLKAHSERVTALAVSGDGRFLASASGDRGIVSWQWPKRRRAKRLHHMTGHFQTVRDVVFTPSGRHLITAGADQALRLWDRRTGNETAQLFSFRTGWAVLTGSGFFDGNLDGDADDRLQAIGYTVRRQSFSMEAFLERYYLPGLLGRLLAGHEIKAAGKTPPSNLAAGFPLPPGVTLRLPRGRDGQWPSEIIVQVEARDQGGGIDEVRLFHNGHLLDASRRTSRRVQKATPETGAVETIGYRVRLTDGPNRFRAVALSRHDRIISEPALASLTHKVRGVPPPPVLHVVAVGINSYKNNFLKLDLKYSVADARGIIERFETLGKPLFERVVVHPLMDRQATRTGIRDTLFNLPGVEPGDTLVLYLAGHGIVIDDEWYFIPWEIDGLEEDDIRRQGLPSKRLFSDIINLPVGQVVILLDSCFSGGAVDAFTHLAIKGPLAKRVSATGIHVASASTGQQSAREADTLGHGLFTQAILDGLQGHADRSPADRRIFVKEVLPFIKNRMTALTHQFMVYDQTPVLFTGQEDFPLVALEGSDTVVVEKEAEKEEKQTAVPDNPSYSAFMALSSRGLPAFAATDAGRSAVSQTDPPPPVAATPTAPAAAGRIEVMSEPGDVDWYVDGRRMGQTPGEFSGLEPGWHTLILKRKGYENWIGDILVADDTISRVVATLKKDRTAPKRVTGKTNRRSTRSRSKATATPTRKRSNTFIRKGMESTGNRVTGWGIAAERD